MRHTTVFEIKFPKFLIADSADDRTFVVHLHPPQFVGEVTGEHPDAIKIEPTFIDDPQSLSAVEVARLMRAAGDFYLEEIDRE